jgi:hypothetical protein
MSSYLGNNARVAESVEGNPLRKKGDQHGPDTIYDKTLFTILIEICPHAILIANINGLRRIPWRQYLAPVRSREGNGFFLYHSVQACGIK